MKKNSITEGCPDCGCPLEVCCGEHHKQKARKATEKFANRLFVNGEEDGRIWVRVFHEEFDLFKKELGLSSNEKKAGGLSG